MIPIPMHRCKSAMALLLLASVGTSHAQSGFDGEFRHFEIGIRSAHVQLRDTRRRGANGLDNANWETGVNYIGSIWGLDEIEDYLPRLYVQFAFNPYFGVGLAYDEIAARTLDWGNPEKTRTGTDGDLQLRGLLYYAFARCPLWLGITPFAEAGGSWYRSDFTESLAWTSYGDGYRFEVDDAHGWFFALGVGLTLSANWSVNLYWRRTFDTSVAARAYFHPGPSPSRIGEFPMAYEMTGAGIACHF